MSSLSQGEAYAILELPVGADRDAVRTSYKRLAQKWLPEKHQNSAESNKLFLNINRAYVRLLTDNERSIMDMNEKDMYKIYHEVVHPNLHRNKSAKNNDCINASENEGNSSNDDDLPLKLRRGASQIKSEQNCNETSRNSNLPNEQREKYANELISEEEKQRRRLEKRKAKKENALKKNGKLENSSNILQKQTNCLSENTPRSDSDEFDAQTTSYTTVSKKKKNGAEIEKSTNFECKQPPPMKNGEEFDQNDPIFLQSRRFAIEGNALANSGLYGDAIDLFTNAIRLDQNDFRFFGNRSFCYERLEDYEQALNDANKAISLSPEWPKGYFRKGKALAGLKNYPGAEEAYIQVLKLDPKCPDAKLELITVRTQQLITNQPVSFDCLLLNRGNKCYQEMGFSKRQAQLAIDQFETVQQALDSLLSGQVIENSFLDEVYSSGDEEAKKFVNAGVSKHSRTVSSSKNNQQTTVQSDNSRQTSAGANYSQKAAPAPSSKLPQQNKAALPPIPQHHYDQAQKQILLNKQQDFVKMNPRNPEGLTSLWVGNVLPDVPQDQLMKMFSEYGQVQSVKSLPDKFCAFINFSNKECAGRAMESLQGTELAGQKLLIKFPDNPVTSSNSNGTASHKSGQPTKTQQTKTDPIQTSSHQTKPQQIKPEPTQSSSKSAAAAIPANAGNRVSGPVNGDECYFWRTTGCQFSGTCRYRHIPEHKGVDKKPWHKSK